MGEGGTSGTGRHRLLELARHRCAHDPERATRALWRSDSSEATEVACGDFESPPFTFAGLVRGTLVSTSHTLLRVLLMVVGIALLWPINLVPIVGSVVWFVISWSWSAFWLAVEHLSAPMARHLYPFSAVVRVLRQRIGLALGFGAALVLLLWIPVVNFLLLPIAIVAGTLLFRGLLRIGLLPAPSTVAMLHRKS
ncbi:MAG: EI24 domain-containing protein [Polyangiaceae bacterium]